MVGRPVALEPVGHDAPGGSAPGPSACVLRRRWTTAALLLAVLLVSAYRLWLAIAFPVQGDENGTLLWIGADYRTILTGFQTWLTMNWYIAGLKLAASLGAGIFELRLVSVVATGAGLFFSCLFVRRRFGTDSLIVFLSLVVANPWLARYDSMIRAYPLATGLMLFLVDQLDRWRSRRDWRPFVLAVVASQVAVVLTSQAAFFLLFVWLWAAALVLREQRSRRRAVRTLLVLAASAIVSLAVVWVFYLPFSDAMARVTGDWRAGGLTSLSFLPETYGHLLGQEWSWVLLALALLGVLRGLTRAPFVATVGLAAYVAPWLMVSVLGISHYPWAFARFHTPFVYPVLLMAAYGSTWVTLLFRSHARSRAGARLSVAPWLVPSTLALAVLLLGVPRQLDHRRTVGELRWNDAFHHVVTRGAPGDVFAVQFPEEYWFAYLHEDARDRLLRGRGGLGFEDLAALDGRGSLWIVTSWCAGQPERRFGSVCVYRLGGGEGSSLAMALYQFLEAYVSSEGRQARLYPDAAVARWAAVVGEQVGLGEDNPVARAAGARARRYEDRLTAKKSRVLEP